MAAGTDGVCALLTLLVVEAILLEKLLDHWKVTKFFIKLLSHILLFIYVIQIDINWIEKDQNGGGRRLTSQGYKDLDRIAAQLKENSRKKIVEEIL